MMLAAVRAAVISSSVGEDEFVVKSHPNLIIETMTPVAVIGGGPLTT